MTTHDLGTCGWLANELIRGFILERPHVDALVREFQRQQPYADANAFACDLVRRKLITPYQADKVLEGDAKSLLVGPYVLAEVIGSGNMGIVYRAIGKADRAAYALRVLPKRSTWNVRLARKQVRAFAELPPHPAVVSFSDVGTTGGMHYLVWPFVTGLTLEAIVREHGPADPQWLARIALQVAEALEVCHRGSIFHGLLKPANILIEGRDQVHLLDFGMGALLSENPDESLIDTMSAANANSNMLDCACPESIVDPNNRGPACDQYSLGCVLYYALTGQYPFPDGSLVHKMMAHQSQRPMPVRQRNPQVPSNLASLVERLLEKDPTGRYPSTNELVSNLRLLTGPETAADPAPTTTVAAGESIVTAARRSSSGLLAEAAVPPLPRVNVPQTSGLSQLTRSLMFWLPTADSLACTAFAPERIRLGDSATILVYPHDPALIETVGALAKAQSPNARCAVAAPLTRPIPRDSRLAIHLGADPLGVDAPLQELRWRGSPVGLAFRLFVPRDCPLGQHTAVISLGWNNRLVGRLEVPLSVEAGKR